MTSPGCAFYEQYFSHYRAGERRKQLTTDSGVNTRPAEPPTVTLNWVAVAWTAAVARRAESLKSWEKSMSSRRRGGGRKSRKVEVGGRERVRRVGTESALFIRGGGQTVDIRAEVGPLFFDFNPPVIVLAFPFLVPLIVTPVNFPRLRNFCNSAGAVIGPSAAVATAVGVMTT